MEDNQATKEELEQIRKLLDQQDKEARAFDKHKKGSKKRARNKRRLLRLRASIRKSWRRVRNLRKKQAEAMGPGQKVREWFEDHEGISENPAGSNCGPNGITKWQHFTGYTWACERGSQGVYWCGCIACFALIKIGGAKIPNKIRLGFNEYINSDAANHTNGLRKIDPHKAKPACIATMSYPHIVTILTAPDQNGNVLTGEGNTSPDASGSQYNGGCVAIKRHHVSEFHIVAEVAGIHFNR